MIAYYFNQFDVVDDETIGLMLRWMPEQQRQLVNSSKLLSRRREQAISYALLLYALDNNMQDVGSDGIALLPFLEVDRLVNLGEGCTNLPQWRVGEHGKPYLTTHEGLFFNISHCRDAVVTAVSSREVGIDVEGRRRFSDTLLQSAFSDKECQQILQSQEPEMEFPRLWTRKESYFKWTGSGILINHLKTTEQEAQDSGCTITTQLVEPDNNHNPFFLSVAERFG